MLNHGGGDNGHHYLSTVKNAPMTFDYRFPTGQTRTESLFRPENVAAFDQRTGEYADADRCRQLSKPSFKINRNAEELLNHSNSNR